MSTFLSLDDLRQRHQGVFDDMSDTELLANLARRRGVPLEAEARARGMDPAPYRQSEGFLGDTGRDLMLGASKVPQELAGLNDLGMHSLGLGDVAYSSDAVDTAYDALGIDDWQERQQYRYSDERQRAREEVDAGFEEGLGEGLKAVAANPRHAVGLFAQSVPGMIGGAKLGQVAQKGVQKLAPQLAHHAATPYVATGVGQGSYSAGQSFYNLMDRDADPERAVPAAWATGGVVGLTSGLGAAATRRLGGEDLQHWLTAGRGRAAEQAAGMPRRMTVGTTSEVAQEIPQSATQQAAMNYGMERPLGEGVGRATIEGAAAGAVGGLGTNVLPRPSARPEQAPGMDDSGTPGPEDAPGAGGPIDGGPLTPPGGPERLPGPDEVTPPPRAESDFVRGMRQQRDTLAASIDQTSDPDKAREMRDNLKRIDRLIDFELETQDLREPTEQERAAIAPLMERRQQLQELIESSEDGPGDPRLRAHKRALRDANELIRSEQRRLGARFDPVPGQPQGQTRPQTEQEILQQRTQAEGLDLPISEQDQQDIFDVVPDFSDAEGRAPLDTRTTTPDASARPTATAQPPETALDAEPPVQQGLGTSASRAADLDAPPPQGTSTRDRVLSGDISIPTGSPVQQGLAPVETTPPANPDVPRAPAPRVSYSPGTTPDPGGATSPGSAPSSGSNPVQVGEPGAQGLAPTTGRTTPPTVGDTNGAPARRSLDNASAVRDRLMDAVKGAPEQAQAIAPVLNDPGQLTQRIETLETKTPEERSQLRASVANNTRADALIDRTILDVIESPTPVTGAAPAPRGVVNGEASAAAATPANQGAQSSPPRKVSKQTGAHPYVDLQTDVDAPATLAQLAQDIIDANPRGYFAKHEDGVGALTEVLQRRYQVGDYHPDSGIEPVSDVQLADRVNQRTGAKEGAANHMTIARAFHRANNTLLDEGYKPSAQQATSKNRTHQAVTESDAASIAQHDPSLNQQADAQTHDAYAEGVDTSDVDAAFDRSALDVNYDPEDADADSAPDAAEGVDTTPDLDRGAPQGHATLISRAATASKDAGINAPADAPGERTVTPRARDAFRAAAKRAGDDDSVGAVQQQLRKLPGELRDGFIKAVEDIDKRTAARDNPKSIGEDAQRTNRTASEVMQARKGERDTALDKLYADMQRIVADAQDRGEVQEDTFISGRRVVRKAEPQQSETENAAAPTQSEQATTPDTEAAQAAWDALQPSTPYANLSAEQQKSFADVFSAVPDGQTEHLRLIANTILKQTAKESPDVTENTARSSESLGGVRGRAVASPTVADSGSTRDGENAARNRDSEPGLAGERYPADAAGGDRAAQRADGPAQRPGATAEPIQPARTKQVDDSRPTEEATPRSPADDTAFIAQLTTDLDAEHGARAVAYRGKESQGRLKPVVNRYIRKVADMAPGQRKVEANRINDAERLNLNTELTPKIRRTVLNRVNEYAGPQEQQQQQPTAPDIKPEPTAPEGQQAPTSQQVQEPDTTPDIQSELFTAPEGQQAPSPSTEPQAPETPVVVRAGQEPPPPREDGSPQEVRVPLKDIKLSKDAAQFKIGANEDGVVADTRLEGEFDVEGAAPIQLWQRNDDSLEVFSGRHRLDLANRTKGVSEIKAQIYRERDGFTAEDARARDAELNIRDDQGQAADYITYFQHRGYTRDEAKDAGLLARTRGKRAFELAQAATPETVAAIRDGQLRDIDAEAIAKVAPKDEALQMLGRDQILNKGKNYSTAAATMEAAQLLRRERAATAADMDLQGDLFGADPSALREAESMGEIAQAKRADLTRRINTVERAANNPEVARKSGVVVESPEATKALISDLKNEKAAWENWPTNPKLVEEVRRELNGETDTLKSVEGSPPASSLSPNDVDNAPMPAPATGGKAESDFSPKDFTSAPTAAQTPASASATATPTSTAAPGQTKVAFSPDDDSAPRAPSTSRQAQREPESTATAPDAAKPREAGTAKGAAPDKPQAKTKASEAAKPQSTVPRPDDSTLRSWGDALEIPVPTGTNKLTQYKKEWDRSPEPARELFNEKVAQRAKQDANWNKRSTSQEAARSFIKKEWDKALDLAAPAMPGTGTAEKGAKYSRGKQAKGSTREAVQAAIRRAVGDPHSDRLHVYQSADEAVAAGLSRDDAETANAWVLRDKDGKLHAHFIADHIAPGRETGVFLHEVGAHMGLDNLLTGEELSRLGRKIQQWGAKNDGSIEARVAKRALDRVKQAQKLGDRQDAGTTRSERLAYFIEEAINEGLTPSALDASTPLGRFFKQLAETFKRAYRQLKFGSADQLTTQELLDMALGAAQIAVETDSAGAKDPEQNRPEAFSRSPMPTMQTLGEWHESLISGGQSALINFGETTRKVAIGFMTRGQQGQEFGDQVPAMREVRRVTTALDAEVKRHEREAAELAQDWANLSTRVTRTHDDLLSRARRLEHDPSQSLAADQRVDLSPEQQKLREDYDVLPDEAKAVFKRVTSHYRKQVTEINELLKELQRDIDPNNTKALEAIELATQRAKDPYIPFLRLGGHFAIGRSRELANLEERYDADPQSLTKAERKKRMKMRSDEDHYFIRGYSSIGRARVEADKLRSRYAVVDARSARHSSAVLQLQSFPEFETLRGELEKRVPKEMLPEIERSLQQVMFNNLPENHALKRRMRSEDIYGEEPNKRVAFEVEAKATARYKAKLKHAKALGDAVDQLRAASEGANKDLERALYNDVVATMDMQALQEPTPIISGLTNASYMAHLGGSLGYLTINSTQVPMVTVPWLGARVGYQNATKQVGRAIGDAGKLLKFERRGSAWIARFDWEKAKRDGILSDDEIELLSEHLTNRNLLDVTIGHELNASGLGGVPHLNSMMQTINMPVHATELINRAATGLAAYRGAHESGRAGSRIDFAAEAVENTQINYSALATPRYMQAPFGIKAAAPLSRMIFQFWRFRQGMLYLTFSSAINAAKGDKEAKRTLYGLMASTALSAGVMEMPMAGAFIWLASMAMGDDEDEYRDMPTAIRNWFHDIDPTLGQVASNGIFSLAGIDISSRIGWGQLHNPMTFGRFGRTDEPKDDFKEAAFQMLGAPASYAGDLYSGAMDVARGDFLDAAQKMTPLKGVRDVMRGLELSQDGITTQRGTDIFRPEDITAGDLVLRSIGLQPKKFGDYYDASSAIYERREAVTGKRDELIQAAYTARKRGRWRELEQINSEIRAFNRRHTDPSLQITSETRRRSERERDRVYRNRRPSGVRGDRSMEPYLDAGRFAEPH